ncbi:MAG TPA: hypothetical protein VIP05_22375, partial [Burkholderiaceae bacterium]
MNAHDEAAALAAFDDWQDATPAQRGALLEKLDPAQRERLRRLIAADRAADAQHFLAEPARLPDTPELAGQQLGAWTL